MPRSEAPFTQRITCAAATAIAVLAIGAGARLATADHHEASEKGPQVIAVKFHADWCGKCQAMGPIFEHLAKKHDTAPVLFVTLDQTEEADRRQARYLAHALGLEKVWAEHGGTTGFILLVDARTRQVVQRLAHDQDFKQMSAALAEAVEAAGRARAG